ncbi:TetR family transcriptional regulator [Mycobacterium sp. BMJ-28]
MTRHLGTPTTSVAQAPEFGKGRVERRHRIVSAAMQLATFGYEHCQIRAVAAAAGIAPSTIYLHFPSKDDLLLACLQSWLSNFETSIYPDFAACPGGYARLLRVFETAAIRLSSSPRLAEALIRPYLCVHGPFTAEADTVRAQVLHLFSNAVGDGCPTALRQPVAEIFADVWVTNISAVAQRRTAVAELVQQLARVVTIIERRNDPHDLVPSAGTARLNEVRTG